MSGNGTHRFAAERWSMVESQLRQRGIRDERLLAAMNKVPRHEFVNQQNWNEAYADHPIPIAEQQTTSQPYMIAAMLQAAQIKPEDRVLEIGAGSGYQTALLAELASQVFAVERYAAMVHWGFPKPRHSMPSLSPQQLHASRRPWRNSWPWAVACLFR
jgi:protein-L-isoaspartate(D-aspartate) O-methyltransferase